MIGIYFSGTGNTKHCVEKLVKLLDVSAQSFPLEHTQMIQILEEHDIFVLGYSLLMSRGIFLKVIPICASLSSPMEQRSA